jgi:L-ascorbate metabolism protein UlaG (beta-lactamase superfamily)
MAANGGNPAGFVIYSEGKNIYFAGDTALTYDMKLLADENLELGHTANWR